MPREERRADARHRRNARHRRRRWRPTQFRGLGEPRNKVRRPRMGTYLVRTYALAATPLVFLTPPKFRTPNGLRGVDRDQRGVAQAAEHLALDPVKAMRCYGVGTHVNQVLLGHTHVLRGGTYTFRTSRRRSREICT